MWTFLLGLIPSAFSSIKDITSAISNERIAAIGASTKKEQIAAEERANALSSQRDVLIAQSSHSNLPVYIGAGFAVGPMVYLNKIFIYDKVMGIGSTDPLDPNLWTVVTIVLGGYFLYSGLRIFK